MLNKKEFDKFVSDLAIETGQKELDEKRKNGETLMMEHVNNKPSREEVLSYTPSQHSFCYSGLHW